MFDLLINAVSLCFKSVINDFNVKRVLNMPTTAVSLRFKLVINVLIINVYCHIALHLNRLLVVFRHFDLR